MQATRKIDLNLLYAAMMRRSSAVIPVILAGRMSPHSSIAILRARRSLPPSW
jgi:dTDP-4-amino-4,6-dideoxygalactose transaminase